MRLGAACRVDVCHGVVSAAGAGAAVLVLLLYAHRANAPNVVFVGDVALVGDANDLTALPAVGRDDVLATDADDEVESIPGGRVGALRWGGAGRLASSGESGGEQTDEDA